jgi:hypothetical protein
LATRLRNTINDRTRLGKKLGIGSPINERNGLTEYCSAAG